MHCLCTYSVFAQFLGNIELVFDSINATTLSHEQNTLDMTLLMMATIQLLQNSALLMTGKLQNEEKVYSHLLV